MVHSFYDVIWQDPELGPIFRTRLDHRREEHLAKMCDFWSSILLGSRRFVGDPMGAHQRIPEIRGQHFDRWLVLFRATLDDVYEPAAADNVFLRATHMRHALERGVEASRAEGKAANRPAL